ncbi:rhodanese-like domain-containing protein [Pseudodesulfovibrio sp.]|uniref:rhodanese-like domain-containing protein n=1 Tax=unclassified Pseudodesulfovibrio TaxID=2661612 RepID=UPI003B004499
MAKSIRMMGVEEVRAYLDGHKPEEYSLLDVRQPGEYEHGHLPGASLVPLSELPDRMDEISKDKPVIAYCASGGRSMAAASLLEGQGFDPVINMVGGFSAWEGSEAFGPMDLGMHAFTGKETSEDVVLMAFAMECRLQEFYVLRADLGETEERIELFMELAGYEDRHKDVLHTLYGRLTGELPDYDAFEVKALAGASDMAEGGTDLQSFLEMFPGAFDGDLGILEFASMVEAQAMDYYLRCAARAEQDETRDTLQLLAREEKAHLKMLARHMDRLAE